MGFSVEDTSYMTAIDIPEQISNLESLHLSITDRDYAESYLHKVSYYRLKPYGFDFKVEGIFKEGTTFENLIDLYTFNDRLRDTLLPSLERIELGLRCGISNYFCLKYGVFGYKKKECFNTVGPEAESHFYDLTASINKTISQEKDTEIVRNFNTKHGGKIPLFALVELFSFGTLAKFYNTMKKEDRQAISKYYGFKEKYLTSWLWSFSDLRNVFAHYDRIYGRKLKHAPTLLNNDKQWVKSNEENTLFPVLICMARILNYDEGWQAVVEDMKLLLDQFAIADPYRLGLHKKWKQILTYPDYDPKNEHEDGYDPYKSDLERLLAQYTSLLPAT